jgi:plastocyanin
VNRAAAVTLRYLAAVLLLVAGLVHLKLYFDGYRDFPDENLGRSFLLSTVAFVVVAIAVAVRRDVWVRIAGIVVSAATLVAFAISRTDRGIFGLTEDGLEPSPEALIALLVEVGAIVILAVLLVTDRAPAGEGARGGEAEAPRTALLIAGGAVVLTVALGIFWNAQADETPPAVSSPATTVAAGDSGASPAAVGIADFAFSPQELTVPAGTEVTWTNGDGVPHSVVAEDGSFRSETLDSGATFSTTFSSAGSYAYLCGIHSSMRGTIIVT